jgi:hypothetical protein
MTTTPTPVRLYAITRAGVSTRLVKANSQAQALRHVATDEYSVTIPSPLETVDLVSQGVVVEVAKTQEAAS